MLFSDGEDIASGGSGGASGGSGASGNDALTAATMIAQNAGIHIETVGVGTAEGTTVTVDGYQLHTALDADRLTAIAQATGGSYHPASDTRQLADVASGIDLRLTERTPRVSSRPRPQGWPRPAGCAFSPSVSVRPRRARWHAPDSRPAAGPAARAAVSAAASVVVSADSAATGA